jgi:acetyl esterase
VTDARALTARQRAELRAARALGALPPRVQVRLSGRPAVELDGQRLAPDVQLLLAVLERAGERPLEELGPVGARAERRRAAPVGNGPPAPVGAVAELSIDGAAGPLRARHYSPLAEERRPAPLVVYLHGGGWVIGDLDTHDGPCRLLCRHAGVHVVSVDYRLAPEQPFPAAIDDACAALRWGLEHAAGLGADPARVAIGGDSAGANLATVACWLAARSREPLPAAQLLVYPVADATARRRSSELFGEGFFLTSSEMDWFLDKYLGGADPADPRVSILRAPDLAGLPPTMVVTAGFDPLRDEGEEYAAAMAAAGNVVALRRFPGLIHGFMGMTGVSRSAREAAIELAGSLRGLLAA